MPESLDGTLDRAVPLGGEQARAVALAGTADRAVVLGGLAGDVVGRGHQLDFSKRHNSGHLVTAGV